MKICYFTVQRVLSECFSNSSRFGAMTGVMITALFQMQSGSL